MLPPRRDRRAWWPECARFVELATWAASSAAVSGDSAAFQERRTRLGSSPFEDGLVRVLIVEDEKKVAGAVRRGLEAEGFAVDVALTGTDGLWMATEHPYDVIVLDIMLPGINGYRVCEQLRDGGNWTPILMLTAKDGEYDHAEALDTGADDYLTKPFSFVVLLARLRALLRRTGRARPVVYTAGDLAVDPVTHRCRRGDVEVPLTAREFAVLEFLLRRAGEVVSKGEILDNVWDFAFEGDPNIVEVYIRHLRRKLDEPFGKQLIETIRGAGYRLDPEGG
jgi:two-component system OmpR family response regulator